MNPPERRHASCVVWRGQGLLIEGPSGAGKSDLALRLLDAGADLVADDLVAVRREGERLIAGPVALPGHLEVRGYGVVVVPSQRQAVLHRVVRLMPAALMPRLPEPATATILGLELPLVLLDPQAASALARLRVALEISAEGVPA